MCLPPPPLESTKMILYYVSITVVIIISYYVAGKSISPRLGDLRDKPPRASCVWFFFSFYLSSLFNRLHLHGFTRYYSAHARNHIFIYEYYVLLLSYRIVLASSMTYSVILNFKCGWRRAQSYCCGERERSMRVQGNAE